MGALINVSINLDKLDKSKIIKGKKGNYYKLTLSVQDETSAFGDNASLLILKVKKSVMQKLTVTMSVTDQLFGLMET